MSDWNDEMIKWEKRDMLTSGQVVAMEGWDLRWEVDRLNKLVKFMEEDIQNLRFELAQEQYAKATLIAELNSIRGKRNG